MANVNAPAATTVLTFRRNHPGGGPLGRCSYGKAGVPGIVVFDLGMFPGGIAPQTITIDCAMVEPQARKVAGVTSAVVAAANVAATVAAGTAAIATPPVVAATAATAAGKLVRKASKAHAAKVG